MDTTEQYIKMCEKAEEIQELRPIQHYNRKTHKETPDLWKDGDWFSADGKIYTYGGDCYHLKQYDDEAPDLGSAGYCEGDGGYVDKIVWLPRQDQLQALSGLDWRSFDKKCLVYESPALVTTKEQAGIRVVMKEKYNKTWDGEDWK